MDFREVAHYLNAGAHLAPPSFIEIHDIATQHLAELHQFYGSYKGVRVARKHIGWYLSGLPGGEEIRQAMNAIEEPSEQIAAIDRFFAGLIDGEAAVARRAA